MGCKSLLRMRTFYALIGYACAIYHFIIIIIIIVTSLYKVTNQPYHVSIYKNYKGCFSLGRVTKYRLKLEILLYKLL